MLSKKEISKISNIIETLKKAERFLLSNNIHVCRENNYPNTLSFVNKDGLGLDSLEKRIGIDLCYLYNGIRDLERMITPVKVDQ